MPGKRRRESVERSYHPVFIVGCARSGTTLLQSLLGAHSLIYTCEETHFFRSLGRSRLNLHGRQLLKKMHRLIDPDGPLVLPQAPTRTACVRAFATLFENACDRHDTSFWLEKTPSHLWDIATIRTYFPQAKFVHMLRDADSVVSSLYRVGKTSGPAWSSAESDPVKLVHRWHRDAEYSLAALQMEGHTAVLYQDLVGDTSSEIRRLCQFLQIPFEDEMLTRYTEIAEKIVSPGEHWKQKNRAKIQFSERESISAIVSKERIPEFRRATDCIELTDYKKDHVPDCLAYFLPGDAIVWDNPYISALRKALKKEGVSYLSGESLLAGMIPNRPFVLHLHWLEHIVGPLSSRKAIASLFRVILLIRECKRRGGAVVFTLHNSFPHKGVGRVQAFIHQLISSVMYRWTDEIIVHSASALLEYKRYSLLASRATATVIPHAGYAKEYPNEVTYEVARKHFGFESEDFVVLLFGRIESYKGHEDLVEAISQYGHKNIKLLLAGACQDMTTFNKIKKIEGEMPQLRAYLQHIPVEDVQLFFNAADVIACPFRRVTTSGSVHLAMRFKKAIIAPKEGYFSEVLDPVGTGLLYDPADPVKGLSKTLQIAFEMSCEERNRIGLANWDRTKGNTWQVIARKTAARYRAHVVSPTESFSKVG